MAMVRAGVFTSAFSIYKYTKFWNTNFVFTSISGMQYEPLLTAGLILFFSSFSFQI